MARLALKHPDTVVELYLTADAWKAIEEALFIALTLSEAVDLGRDPDEYATLGSIITEAIKHNNNNLCDCYTCKNNHITDSPEKIWQLKSSKK